MSTDFGSKVRGYGMHQKYCRQAPNDKKWLFVLLWLWSFLFFFPTQRNDTKTSRVRTNYKLRVGEKPIGRYTEYSQVRIPPNGHFGSEDAQKYYRHPKVSVYKKLESIYRKKNPKKKCLAEGREFVKFLRSLEQFIQAEQFLVTECFLTCSWRFLISNKLEQIGKKYWDLETCRKS